MNFEARKGIVALVGDQSSLSHLVEILDFFKVPFVVNPADLKGWMLIVLYRNQTSVARRTSAPMLCIPSNTKDFHRFIGTLNVHADSIEEQIQLNLRLRGLVTMKFCVSHLYSFTGPVDVIASFSGKPIILRIRGTDVYFLAMNLVEEMHRSFENRLNLEPSIIFKMCTRVSIESIIPRTLGNKVLGLVAHRDVLPNVYLSHMNLLDGLRFLLLAAIVISSQETVKTLGFWRKGTKYATVITHDVDTRYGFEKGINLLRSVERRLGVRSAWNIPVGSYEIDPEIIKNLVSEGCEICSHGYRHDGRMISAGESEVAEGLRESRRQLMRVSRTQIKGFRAPLLQHSRRILEAAQKAGFIYDSSLPAWEVHSRTDGRSHGIGTVYPFILSDSLVELVVTLPQDHQLLYLGGLSPEEILEIWKILKNHIKLLGGLCNLIVHPDIDLFGRKSMLSYYEDFIEEITGDLECWLTTPSEVAEWWLLRDRINSTLEGRCVPTDGGNDDTELAETFELVEYRPCDFIF